MRWAAIDFETATTSRASACALGVVIVDDGVERFRQSWLIRPPGNVYDPRTIAVHGITPDITVAAPDFAQVWTEAMSMIDDRPLVAHNAAFDIGVVRGGCAEHDLTLPGSAYVCTVQLARRTWPELRAHKLPVVAEHVGVELNHHDALSDAAACSRILGACIEAAGVTSVAQLTEHHGLNERRVSAA